MFKRKGRGDRDPSARISPIQAMAFEADVVNLLGKGAGDTDHSGDQNRISYQEAQVVQAKLVAQVAPYIRGVEYPSIIEGRDPIIVQTAVLPEDLSQAVRDSIVEGVGRIADGTMSGHELSRFSVVTNFFASGWWQEDGKHVEIQGGELFAPMARTANGLTYAIAMLEGNLPPNDLGYRADEQVSLANKYEIVKSELERAGLAAQATIWPPEGNGLGPGITVFGDIGTTRRMFNDVVDRAEMHRPEFMGTVIGEQLPRI